jgi:hypothetical protein
VSDEPVTPRIDPADPLLRRAVVQVIDSHAAEILVAASARMDAEADRRRDRGHDVEHVAGWREAAQWQREQAVRA